MEVALVAVGFLALLAVAGSGWAIYRSGLRPVTPPEVEALAAKATAVIKSLGDEVEEMIDRARDERRRVNGRKGGRPAHADQNGQDGPAIATRQDYEAHLMRGGKPNPDIERALGI